MSDGIGPVTETTRLTAHGQTAVSVTPPAPCGLGDCVAELHVTIRADLMRVHLSAQQRAELIVALGGRL